MGGVHGVNRLGGSSLLDCVVFGRVAGASASRVLMQRLLAAPRGASATSSGSSSSDNRAVVEVTPGDNSVRVEVSWAGGAKSTTTTATKSATTTATTKAAALAAPTPARAPADAPPQAAAAPSKAATPAAKGVPKQRNDITLDEVKRHNKKDDCWVIINGQVLDATPFLNDHPGGAKAILLYAGRDATEEFNMLHKPDVIARYAPEIVLGTLAGATPKAKL